MRDDHLLPLPELDTWRNDAACRGHDTALWFDPTRQAEGLAICDTCPVDDPCRIAGRREEGIWGGVVKAAPPPPRPAPAGEKCDRCSRLHDGRWTACTCPGGPTRQPIPASWKRGGT